MSILDRFDFVGGNLPPWAQNAVDLARPFFTAVTIAIPAIGGSMVGTVAFFAPERAYNMAKASAMFFQGIPEVAWGAIATIAVGYTAAKTIESVKGKPQPLGRPAPEDPVLAPRDLTPEERAMIEPPAPEGTEIIE